MSESVAILEVRNFPVGYDWNECRTLFSEYGKVVKLYMQPDGTYAKVYFDTIENAYKAQRELNGKPPLNLVISEPQRKDFKAGSKPITDSATYLLNNDSALESPNMNMQGYYDNYDDIQGSLSHGYVDIFGRVVTTLEADDGEMYMSLEELKKSGFELFEAGTLPRRGQHRAFDEQLVNQFELYMKMKAAKFMSRNQLKIPEERVNHVIDREKNKYFDMRQDRVVQHKHGLLTITSSPNMSSSQASRSFRSGSQYSNRGKPFSKDEDRSSVARRKSSFNNNEQKFNNSFKDDTSNFHKPQLRRPHAGTTYNEINSNSPPSRKGGFKSESSYSEPKPLTRAALTTNINQKEDDGTYTVRAQTPKSAVKETSPQTNSPSTSSNLKDNDSTVRAQTPKSALKPISPKVNPPSNSPNLEASVSSENKPQKQQNAEITPQPVSSQRKIVIEDICDNGIFELVEVINDTTFVGFAMPMTYNEEILLLEGINDECQPDPLFKPKLGQLVAAQNREEMYVRAMIINNLNGKYACALIDYGYVVQTEDVRPLPERYRDIPEFSFLCVTDATVLQNLKAEKSDNMSVQIKTPSVLTVKAESGKEFVLKGIRWDAFETSPLAIKKKVEETQAIFKERPPHKQLKSNDTVVIIGEHNGYLLVRTRECNSLLKEVNQELCTYKGIPFKQQPEVDYLAVCPYNNDNNLYRVAVISISNANAMVDYIDYGNFDTIPLKELKNINKKLATMDSTLIKISLKGFTTFTVKALQFLTDCSERKEKFVVGAVSEDNVYELLLADKSHLSEKLASLDKPATPKPVKTPAPVANKNAAETVSKPKQTSSAIKWDEVPIAAFDKGMHNVMCMFAGNVAEGCVTFCLATNEAALALSECSEKIKEYVGKDTEPYCPQELEVCLAKFEDEWYRAAIIEADSNKYGLYYIDYGNSHSVTSNDIRKIPKDIANIKCNTAFCQLDGVLKDKEEKVREPLLSALQKGIVEDEIYDINVIDRIEGAPYAITIPALYEGWKKEGLL